MSNIEFTLPIRGVNYGFSVDKTPPEYSGYMDNVRPRDVLENRVRLGQRPGMDYAYSQQIGGASSPIVAMCSVTKVARSVTTYENITTGDDSHIHAYTVNRKIAQTFTPTTSHTITSVNLLLHKVGNPGTLTIGIYPVNGSNKPDTSGAALASGTFDGDTLTTSVPGSWYTISFGSGTALTASTQYAMVLSVTADATGTSDCVRWRHDTSSPTYTGGQYWYTTDGGSSWTAPTGADQMFEELGTTSSITPGFASKQLVAVGNNELWYETSAGTMAELSAANGGVNTNNKLSMIEGFQKAFIANDTNLKVFDLANTKIATSSVGSNPPDSGNVLTGGDSGAKMVVDYITALSSACTIYGYKTTVAAFISGETVTGTDDDNNSISFTTSAAETAPPHWYTYGVYGADSSFGVMPDQAILACLYRGRVVLAGNEDYPHQWYMTKVGQPFNLVYDSTDPLTAVKGGNSDAGEIGDIITALIPYKDDYLIFGCSGSVWMLMGDAAHGGSIIELSLTTGIWGQKAWCFDDMNNLYFFGLNGVYRIKISGQGVSPPENISETLLPNLVSDWDLDDTLHEIVLEYDPIHKGIIISKTIISSGVVVSYWYDLRTEGFYPESYPSACGVFSSFNYNATDATYRKLLFGGNDGYIRYFNDSKKDDETGTNDTTISSYMTLPIQQLSEDFDMNGKSTSLTIELAGGASGGDFSDTDGVSYELHKGKDAETVLEDIRDGATAFTSGTLSGTGRKPKIRARVRGGWLGIKFYNSTATETWAVNKVYGTIVPAGRIK